jgi:hypothetical protein
VRQGGRNRSSGGEIAVGDHHPRPATCEFASRGRTEASAGAGDQNDSIVEPIATAVGR